MDNRDIWINNVQSLNYKIRIEIYWISNAEFGNMDIIHAMTTHNHLIISATMGQSNLVCMARQQLPSRMNQRDKFYPNNKNE